MKRAIIAAAAILALSGCTSPGAEQPEANQGDEAEQAAVIEPCEVFTESDLEAIFDQNLGEGTSGSAEVDVSGTPVEARDCLWSVDGIEASVRVAQAADFDGGALECAEPTGGMAEAVEGLGSQAWWYQTDAAEGTEGLLRACSENMLVDVMISGSADTEGAYRRQAQAVVEVVLTAGE